LRHHGLPRFIFCPGIAAWRRKRRPSEHGKGQNRQYGFAENHLESSIMVSRQFTVIVSPRKRWNVE
jgi:hypothetical protein